MLKDTNLSGAEKRKYRDWSPERLAKELGIRQKENTIQTSGNIKINDIAVRLKSYNANVKKTKEIVYMPLNQSRLAYGLPYTYVVEYQYYYGSDKKNRETDYMTIQDTEKLSYSKVIKMAKEYFASDDQGKYQRRNAIAGSFKIVEAYEKTK
jgi:hypothetical protein